MNAYRICSRLLATAMLLASAGCAAMFDGTKKDVTFTSHPAGATVLVEGRQYVTPATVNVKKDVDTAVISLAGYPDRKLVWKRDFQAGYLLMDILFTPGFGLSGLLIDGATSAYYKHPPLIHYDFERAVANIDPPASAPIEAAAAAPSSVEIEP